MFISLYIYLFIYTIYNRVAQYPEKPQIYIEEGVADHNETPTTSGDATEIAYR